MVLGDPSPALKSPVKIDPNTARPAQMDRRLAPEAAPNVAPEAPKPPLVSYLDPSTSQPKLAIPVAGAAKPTMKSGNGGATGAANGGLAAPGDGNDLLVVGVDPAPAGIGYSSRSWESPGRISASRQPVVSPVRREAAPAVSSEEVQEATARAAMEAPG